MAEHNDWRELENMLEEWILNPVNRVTFQQRQALIPTRDYIFEHTEVRGSEEHDEQTV